MGDDFEWGEQKAARNILAHFGISFDVAAEVFQDAFAVESEDTSQWYGERRFVMIGMDSGGRLLTVVYTERELRRIISARKATTYERRHYHRQNSKDWP